MTLIKPSIGGSSGGDVIINATGNAQPQHVLTPYTFSNAEGVDKVGTCTFDANTSDGNAVAEDLGNGKIAYVKGAKIIGTSTKDADTSDADAVAVEILKGKSAYVKGQKITGALADNYIGLDAGNNVSIPAEVRKNADESYFYITGDLGDATADNVLQGYTFTTNAGVKQVGRLVPLDTSDATAAANEILKGETAYVNGQKLTGTLVTLNTSDATAVDREICMDKTAYVNGQKITGNGMIYKKTNLTGWYGSGAVSGTSASCNYVRLLKLSGFTIIGGWLNIKQGSTEYQLRIGGAGARA